MEKYLECHDMRKIAPELSSENLGDMVYFEKIGGEYHPVFRHHSIPLGCQTRLKGASENGLLFAHSDMSAFKALEEAANILNKTPTTDPTFTVYKAILTRGKNSTS